MLQIIFQVMIPMVTSKTSVLFTLSSASLVFVFF